MKYESTYNKEYTPYNVDSYRDVGNSVRVCFKENTNQLESINAESLEIQITDQSLNTIEQLITVCDVIIEPYIDIAKYQTRCTTYVKIQDENGVENKTYEGFISKDDFQNSVITYKLEYIYYIDGCATGDAAVIRLGGDGFLQNLSFNMIGGYDKYSESQN